MNPINPMSPCPLPPSSQPHSSQATSHQTPPTRTVNRNSHLAAPLLSNHLPPNWAATLRVSEWPALLSSPTQPGSLAALLQLQPDWPHTPGDTPRPVSRQQNALRLPPEQQHILDTLPPNWQHILDTLPPNWQHILDTLPPNWQHILDSLPPDWQHILDTLPPNWQHILDTLPPDWQHILDTLPPNWQHILDTLPPNWQHILDSLPPDWQHILDTLPPNWQHILDTLPPDWQHILDTLPPNWQHILDTLPPNWQHILDTLPPNWQHILDTLPPNWQQCLDSLPPEWPALVKKLPEGWADKMRVAEWGAIVPSLQADWLEALHRAQQLNEELPPDWQQLLASLPPDWSVQHPKLPRDWPEKLCYAEWPAIAAGLPKDWPRLVQSLPKNWGRVIGNVPPGWAQLLRYRDWPTLLQRLPPDWVEIVDSVPLNWATMVKGLSEDWPQRFNTHFRRERVTASQACQTDDTRSFLERNGYGKAVKPPSIIPTIPTTQPAEEELEYDASNWDGLNVGPEARKRLERLKDRGLKLSHEQPPPSAEKSFGSYPESELSLLKQRLVRSEGARSQAVAKLVADQRLHLVTAQTTENEKKRLMAEVASLRRELDTLRGPVAITVQDSSSPLAPQRPQQQPPLQQQQQPPPQQQQQQQQRSPAHLPLPSFSHASAPASPVEAGRFARLHSHLLREPHDQGEHRQRRCPPLPLPGSGSGREAERTPKRFLGSLFGSASIGLPNVGSPNSGGADGRGLTSPHSGGAFVGRSGRSFCMAADGGGDGGGGVGDGQGVATREGMGTREYMLPVVSGGDPGGNGRGRHRGGGTPLSPTKAGASFVVEDGTGGFVIPQQLRLGGASGLRVPSRGAVEFRKAIERGDLSSVERMLADGFDLKCASPARSDCRVLAQFESPPLHTAVKHGHAGVVGLLLRRGARIEALDKGGWTPLHYAAREGHTEVAALLIGSGAQLDVEDRYHDTPLYVAANNAHGRTVALLIEAGADRSEGQKGTVAVKGGMLSCCFSCASGSEERALKAFLQAYIHNTTTETETHRAAAKELLARYATSHQDDNIAPDQHKHLSSHSRTSQQPLKFNPTLQDPTGPASSRSSRHDLSNSHLREFSESQTACPLPSFVGVRTATMRQVTRSESGLPVGSQVWKRSFSNQARYLAPSQTARPSMSNLGLEALRDGYASVGGHDRFSHPSGAVNGDPSTHHDEGRGVTRDNVLVVFLRSWERETATGGTDTAGAATTHRARDSLEPPLIAHS
ncbi:MAG: hypothetical protein WDW36_008245 [Sanguina aurantia]